MLHSNSPFDSTFSSDLPTRSNPPPLQRSGPGRVPNVLTTEPPRGLPPSRIPERDKFPIGALARNDKVAVLINGRGWAIGIILAVLEALDSCAGLRYTVQFFLPDKQTWQTRNFSAADVYPENSWDR